MNLWKMLFYAWVVCAGLAVWLVPHPPLVDLPQHAGQVALALDLFKGTSPWVELFRLNYFTPYLVGYALAGLAALVFPIAVAMKIVLTIAFYAFVVAGIALRKAFQGDERLDWLLPPGFFGFAFKWGFFPFLVAAPVGLFFVLLGKGYSDRPTARNTVYVFLFAILLFFCHGLIFLMAFGLGALFVLLNPERTDNRLGDLAPYVAAAPIVIAYYLYTTHVESPISAGTPGVKWFLGPQRLLFFLTYVWGTPEDVAFAAATVIALAVPFLLGSRLQQDRRALAPFVCLAIAWLIVPFAAMKTDFLYSRFALFTLPFYAFMFRAPSAENGASAVRRFARAAGLAAMPLVCAVFLGTQVTRMIQFGHESADFASLVAEAQPSRRALALVFDPSSPAANNLYAYLNYAAWYQAERSGLVDFNFAAYISQMVRYKPEVLTSQPQLILAPRNFDWTANHGSQYDYFFVRSPVPLAPDLLANPQCEVKFVASAGKWYLYEKRACR